MTAEIIIIDPHEPERAFSRCREVVRAGGVIAYPTETFYGLGADPENVSAVGKIFSVKGRPADQPLLLLIKNAAEVERWAVEVPPKARALMEKFWPGPLTLVFTARADVAPGLTGGTGTIGLRVPGSALTRRLLEFLGTALTGTSANVTGRQSPRTAREAAAAVGQEVDLILDGGTTAGGKPSTVVDVRGGYPRVIREGAFSEREVLTVVA